MLLGYCFDTNMASSFENSDVILSKENAEHINERHVRLDINTKASKFKQPFNLTSCLVCLTKMMWEEQSNYEIIQEGFIHEGHVLYFMYVFTLTKVIGMDPWGFPSRKICIYFSWRPSTDSRFHIISTYPYSVNYYYFLRQRNTLAN